jgi:hypothetical protein
MSKSHNLKLSKNLGATSNSRFQFHAEGPQILGATVRKLVTEGDRWCNCFSHLI